VAHMTAAASKCRKKRNTEGTEIGAAFEAPLEARGKQGKQRPQRAHLSGIWDRKEYHLGGLSELT
jgi:hypothetical protein